MIKIVAIGKVKDKHLDALIQDYCKRINRYHKLQVVEVKDEAIINDEKALLDKEASRALKQIGKDEYVILLDLHGKAIDSLSFAEKLDLLMISHPKICFVIGGSLGIGEKLYERADEKIKLSDLTFLHQMSRLILCEQIYRSFKILHHETYHK